MNDSLLQAKAREAMQAGALPKRAPDRMWGGPATGARCAVCGASTEPGEVELELEFTRESSGRTRHFVHPSCFSIFRLEVERVLRVAARPGTQPATGAVGDEVPRHDNA